MHSHHFILSNGAVKYLNSLGYFYKYLVILYIKSSLNHAELVNTKLNSSFGGKKEFGNF